MPSNLPFRVVGWIAIATLSLSIASQLIGHDSWPQFRGPNASGGVEDDNTSRPVTWSATENIQWKRDIDGRGWSSPIVSNDRIFVTTVVGDSKGEEPKKGLYFGGDRSTPSKSVHRWIVLCLELSTGKVRWERVVHEGVPRFPIHIKSSYASETSVTDGRLVYVCFGNVGLYALDFDGNLIWKSELDSLPMRSGWGTAASPALHEGKLFVVRDNESASYIAALDAGTGKELWQRSRNEKSNWSTPYLWKTPQRTEVVTTGSQRVVSYDLDGNELWSLQGMSSITIATPYEANGLLIVSSGYVLDSKRPIYAIRPGASGDITLKAGERSNDSIAWSLPKSAPYNPSTLAYRGRVYSLYDRGTAAAFGIKDGASVVSERRIPEGGAFTSSPWAYDGKVFFLNEDGVTFVYSADDNFSLLATNRLSDDDMGMSTPAILADRLILRTSRRIYSIKTRTD
jgi:outer membrane protein assembly factor BamB